jgi:hypothetical protein
MARCCASSRIVHSSAWRSICTSRRRHAGHGKASLDQKVAHHLSIEGIPSLGWPPAFAVEIGGDIRQEVAFATELVDPRHEVLVGAELVEASDWPDQLMCGAIAAVPVAFDAHLFTAVDDFDQHSLQQQTDDGLTLLLSCGVPECRHILRQTLDRGDLGRTQGLRLLAPEPFVLSFKARVSGQGLFPLGFKRTRDQAVLRFYGIVLPTCPLGLVKGALDAMPPLPVKRLSLAGNIAGGSQARFQRRRLQRLQHKPCHQRVERRGLERLTGRLGVVTGHADAGVAGKRSIVVVLRHHPQATTTADHHPGQQRLPGTRHPGEGRLV